MKTKIRARNLQSTLFLLVLLSLGGCTLVTYNLQDELPKTKNVAACDIAFTLNLQSISHTNSYGTKQDAAKRRKALKNKYIESTLSKLEDLGCNARHAASRAEANFNISVYRRTRLSPLPQEWLTGLSFGAIPSWGTRKDQFNFSFTDRDSDRSYSYQVDEKVFNHTIFFPVFWVSYFTADEQRVYQNALSNFIKGS